MHTFKLNDITNQTSKSLISTDSFATSNPYDVSKRINQTFRCEVNETVHIRLDQERGFETERDYDVLFVEWDGYRGQVHGSIEQLPAELKQADWFDTNSSTLYMQFDSDSVIAFKDATYTK